MARPRVNGPLPVDRLTECIHDPPDQCLADGNVENPARTPDNGPFLDVRHFTEAGGADVVRLEVEHEPHQAAGELEELARHGPLQTVDARDAVSHAEDGSGLGRERGLFVVLNLLLDDRRDLFGPELHVSILWVRVPY